MGFFDRGPARSSSTRDINNGRPDAGTDREIDSAGRGKPQPKDSYSKTPNKPPPPGGGKVWDYTNEQWVDMPNLDPRRPWSRTGTDGTRTGDPNERLWHEPGSASGNWSPTYYHWDENGNWVPKPNGKYGMPENDDGTPIFTPDPIKYPEYFARGSTPEEDAARAAQYKAKDDAKWAGMLDRSPRLQAAYQALKDLGWDPMGDNRDHRKQVDYARGKLPPELQAAMKEFKEASYRARFGVSDDWERPEHGITPRSPSGQYWYRPPGSRGPEDPGVRGPTPPGVSTAAPEASRTASTVENNPMFEGYQGGGVLPGASTGQTDVLAALSRIQGLPIGAPTAATGAMGGFGKAASAVPPAAAMKKPTIVRRGGGRVDAR